MRTQDLVHDFMVATGLDLPNEDRPGLEGLNIDLLRRLVKEEAEEFDEAMGDLDAALDLNSGGDPVPILAEVIDAMCDIIVVVHNTSNAIGVDLEPFFEEVHRSNMAKVGGRRDSGGKLTKPVGWEPPRIEPMLRNALAAENRIFKLGVVCFGVPDVETHYVTTLDSARARRIIAERCWPDEIESVWTRNVYPIRCEDPSCIGVVAGPREVDGFVEIRRCRACDVFESNADAAASVSDCVRWYCPVCRSVHDPIRYRCVDNNHGIHVVIPFEDACAAGLL
jgi:hypothetical protein